MVERKVSTPKMVKDGAIISVDVIILDGQKVEM